MNMVITDRDRSPVTVAHHLKKSILATAITFAMGTASFTADAGVTSGDTLNFVLGTVQVSCAYGTAPPCIVRGYEITDIVGSYFGVDFNGSGSFTAEEKTPIGSLNGIVIGALQPASGSHPGPIDGTESPNIDQPWTFFGGVGMHQTATAITALTDAGSSQTLDMTGWNITWNGIPSIPLTQLGDATLSCDTSCSFGENFTLDGAFHIAGAGFTTVPYTLHLEGNIGIEPSLPPSVNIGIEGGSRQECDITGGNNISMSARVFTPEPDDVASIVWFLDDVLVGQGAAIDVFVPLGAHTVKVILDTTQSGSAENTTTVVVQDTVAPEVTLGFLDAKSGAPLTSLSGTGKLGVKILAEATDVCDPDTVVDATVGTPAINGDVVTVNRSRKTSTIELSSATAQETIELRVQAEDTSGNTGTRTTRLNID